MQGHWLGKGERHYLQSGRRVEVEIEVESRVVDDRLVSENRIREQGKPEYNRIYWVRADQEFPGRYVLGYGTAESPPAPGARGHFDFVSDPALFEVVQSFGGNPPLWIRSVTEFQGDQSFYNETGWHGETQLSETQIRFLRIPGNPGT